MLECQPRKHCALAAALRTARCLRSQPVLATERDWALGWQTTVVAGQRRLAARALDPAAAHDAVRVGTEDDLQQHRRRVGRRAGRVIPKAGIEARQINRVLEQVMAGVLKGAGGSCSARGTAKNRGFVSTYL
jgi:hypothetical protein